ncbi:MAG: response regulator [Deltaproteobacteria bacterium]|nr:response regulator [Deltaproteobacteria bacterium]
MPPSILLVEDNALARRNMVVFFTARGYQVSEADRGEDAIRLIRDIDNFDVVITDLRMPGMIDGLDVLRYQSEVSPGTKSILMTGFGSDQIKNQAISIGAVYLDKPIRLNDLLVEIQNLTLP